MVESKKSGRPKSEEKYHSILENAGHLFLMRGLQGTSMDAIAEAANVSKRTVYSHFQDKEDLFRTVIQEKVHLYQLDQIEDPETREVADVLTEIATKFLELIFDPEVTGMFRMVISEAVAHPKMAELFFENGPRRSTQKLAELLEHWKRSGDLQVEDVEYSTHLFYSMLKGSFHMMQLMNVNFEVSEKQQSHHIQQVVRDFLKIHINE